MSFRIAKVEDMPDVVSTLAVAFAEDPVLSFLYSDEKTRPMMLAAFFATRLMGGLGIDEVSTVSGCVSASVWVPPRRPGDIEPDWRGVLSASAALLGEQLATERFSALARIVEAHPRTPHWYLAFVGTRPEARGAGSASDLITAMTDRCDVEGYPAYLESSEPENVAFYERHGFLVTGEVEIDSGPTVPLMWRDPQT